MWGPDPDAPPTIPDTRRPTYSRLGKKGGEAPGGNPSPRANTASSKSRSTVGNEDEYECLERRPCNRVGDVWCSVVVRWRQREGIGGGVGVQRNLLGLEGACWYY